MERVVVIRFGEIFLKGKNRDYFESLLIHNIKDSLKSIQYTFTKSQGRYFVEGYEQDMEFEIIDRLKKVFGIYSLSIAEKVQTDEAENYKRSKEECFSVR